MTRTRSSGPRTPEGKAAVSRNSTTHGGNSANAAGQRTREVRLALRKKEDYACIPLVRHCPYRPCSCPQEEGPCPVLAKQWDRGFRFLMGRPHVRPEQAGAARLVMDDRITYLQIRGYLQKVGLMRASRSGLDVQPAVRALTTVQASLARGLQEFGLTPLAWKELGLEGVLDLPGEETLEQIQARYAAQDAEERAAQDAQREPEEPERQEGQE